MSNSPCAFQPSIPNLIYQYHLFVNYESTRLAVGNPEIDGVGTSKGTGFLFK